MKHRFDQITSDFKCKHCDNHVSTDPFLSGVNNRNHCPYCLYSRHLDHFEPGDRLSACRAEMRPIGLTLKRTNKKYGKQQGELMIIHQCIECGKISANRIAADDIASTVFEIYRASLHLDLMTRASIEQSSIILLERKDEEIVHARLFGWREPAALTRSYA